jgi:adenylate cyclase
MNPLAVPLLGTLVPWKSRLASCYGHFGRTEAAQAAWAELLKVNPDFSLMQRARVLPYKHDRDFQRIADGLAKAGLP